MSFFESMICSYAEFCSNQTEYLKQVIEKLPPGEMRHYRNGKYIRFLILIPGQKPFHVRSKNLVLKKRMAKKAVWMARRRDRLAELEICRICIKLFERLPHAEEQVLADPYINALLSQESSETDVKAWLEEPYQRSSKNPEHLKVPSAAGFPVRSKVEAIIIMLLMELKIPFRYEQEYYLDGIYVAPDFTLLHPRRKITAILEFFGLMGDPEYRNRAADKIRMYISNGYRMQHTLLVFFEYPDMPFDVNKARDELVRWMQ